MVDTIAIVDKRMIELNPLHKRMDDTRKRVYSTPYQMPDLGDPKKAMDGVINVSMPYAAIIANTVINDIASSFRQTVVEGDISSTTERHIEQFITYNREQADELLVNSDWHAALDEIWASHVCVRSYFGVRWVSQIIDGKYVINILPLDMRYVAYEYGTEHVHFNWVNNRTFRPWSSIEAEYKAELEAKGITHSNIVSNTQVALNIQVDDFWSTDRHELWVGGKQLIDQRNPFGEPPFVIAAPASGFMLRDQGYIEHDAEDVLSLVRPILDELNRSASIEQTKGAETIRPPYVEPQEKLDGKPGERVPVTGQVKRYKKGEEPILLETPDINQAFLTSRQDLAKVLQQAGVNDIDLGNVSQTVSAVWITAQAGIRKKFSGSRLKAMAQGDQQLGRLMIRQTQNEVELESGSPDILVGGMGRKKKFSVSVLGDPEKYGIRIELRSQSKTEEIANLAQFVAAPELPFEYRLENILGVNDPKKIMRMKDLEVAEELDPALRLSRLGISYAQEAAEVNDEQEADALKLQSMMLIERAVFILKQRLLPAPPQLPEGAQSSQPRPGAGSQPLVQLPQLLGPGNGGLQTQQQETPAV